MPAIADINLTGHFLGRPDQRAGFLVLAAFLASFLFIRTSARLIRSPRVSWWPGSVETESGLHIHHLVWGIVLALLAGFLEFAIAPGSPWLEVFAVLFGIGAGLTLDEFALWLRLEDVYWGEQGRESVDAVIVATLIGGMIVAGLAPLDTNDGGSIAAIAGAVLFDLALVVVAVWKGKLLSGLAGVFVPLVALVAAVRLGRPGSRWAARRYPEGSRKHARALARATRWDARRDRALDLFTGAPSEG